jgi:hypothetical protein
VNDYNWYEFQNVPLAARFPDNNWLSGVQEWVAGLADLTSGNMDVNRQSALQWLDQIRRAPLKPGSQTCPRVFVSHKQIDKDCALRVAWLAGEEGFDYWIDVIDLDPVLNPQITKLRQTIQTNLGRSLTPFEESVLLAAIIEMGLLNCTHVLAVMTSNTTPSRWVPYEYGRMKRKTLHGAGTSCWWDTTSLPQEEDLPEYAHLAAVHPKEQDIRDWFNKEVGQFPKCSGARRGTWSVEPPALPTG